MYDGHTGRAVPAETLDELLSVGVSVRENLKNRLKWMTTSVESPDGEEYLQTWELVLATLCWDVGGSALRLGRDEELRAARILDRSIIEYAFRLNYYIRNPDIAERHFRQVNNFSRHVMKASATYKGDMTLKQLRQYNQFITSGTHKFSKPTSDDMMEATLLNLGHSGTALAEKKQYLESEYSVGSAITHGSQGAILDVIAKQPNGSIEYHERSHHFSQFDSLYRTTMSLILFLKAMEYHHNIDMGADMHIRDLELRFMQNGPLKFSVFTHVPFGP
ncbi:MAG TPA: hypothetical protein VFB22_00785 [Candidatus Baltobacteraceae bacterium]|nr:hypothetical protein [Candidatus Baltobacteraceae bacterium]